MSVALKYGSLFVLGLVLWSPVGHAQEADDDLRLDTSEDYGDIDDIEPPPAPPPDPQPLTISEDEPQVVRRRTAAADPYAATGLRAGEAFLLFPELKIDSVVTSNAARSSNGTADIGLRIRPSIQLQSDWSRHQLTFSASAEVLRYLENPDASTNSIDTQTALRLDVRRGTELELQSGYSLDETPASDSEVPDTAIGARLSHTLTNAVSLAHDMGPLQTKLRAGLIRQVYNDVELVGGGTEDNSDRNQTELQLSLRGTYRAGAKLQPFAEVSYTPRYRDASTDRNGLNRNSKGYGLTAGLAFADEPFWSGEVAATYLVRDYNEASLDTMSAPGLLANLLWRPTDLTTVNFNAQAALDETAEAGESARISYNFGLGVTHALKDNVTLEVGTALALDNGDPTLGLRAGVEWQVNPLLAVNGSYDGSFNDDYTEHRLTAGVTLRH